jgi:hypothetical protein
MVQHESETDFAEHGEYVYGVSNTSSYRRSAGRVTNLGSMVSEVNIKSISVVVRRQKVCVGTLVRALRFEPLTGYTCKRPCLLGSVSNGIGGESIWGKLVHCATP